MNIQFCSLEGMLCFFMRKRRSQNKWLRILTICELHVHLFTYFIVGCTGTWLQCTVALWHVGSYQPDTDSISPTLAGEFLTTGPSGSSHLSATKIGLIEPLGSRNRNKIFSWYQLIGKMTMCLYLFIYNGKFTYELFLK